MSYDIYYVRAYVRVTALDAVSRRCLPTRLFSLPRGDPYNPALRVCIAHSPSPPRLAASALCGDVCTAQAGAAGPAASARAFQGNFNYSPAAAAAAAAAAATPNNREHFALDMLA